MGVWRSDLRLAPSFWGVSRRELFRHLAGPEPSERPGGARNEVRTRMWASDIYTPSVVSQSKAFARSGDIALLPTLDAKMQTSSPPKNIEKTADYMAARWLWSDSGASWAVLGSYRHKSADGAPL